LISGKDKTISGAYVERQLLNKLAPFLVLKSNYAIALPNLNQITH
jgi:hypothetical protein